MYDDVLYDDVMCDNVMYDDVLCDQEEKLRLAAAALQCLPSLDTKNLFTPKNIIIVSFLELLYAHQFWRICGCEDKEIVGHWTITIHPSEEEQSTSGSQAECHMDVISELIFTQTRSSKMIRSPPGLLTWKSSLYYEFQIAKLNSLGAPCQMETVWRFVPWEILKRCLSHKFVLIQ